MSRLIDLIVIHCSATRPSMEWRAADVRRLHTSPDPNDPSKPWRDIGYHWVIGRDGRVEQGRREGVVGAHAFPHNANSIGVCLIGGLDKDGRPSPVFTPPQMEALRALLADMTRRYPEAAIRGHGDLPDVGARACPCFAVGHWLVTGSLVPIRGAV